VHSTARPEKWKTKKERSFRESAGARDAEAPTKNRNTARRPNIGKADAGKVPNLEPDRKQIETFVDALFRYATPGSYVSLRSFTDDDKVFSITPVRLTEGHALIDKAYDEAARAANAGVNVVFCPPVATFSGRDAKRVNVVDGVALTVELDARPQAARHRLEELLGPATVVVASGGMWLNPETGESEPKLHVHYRLTKPARGDEREFLGKARRLATEIVGGDTSNIPISHPIRWPGSWHRKGEPKLCCIESLNADREIELADALEILRKVKTERDSETEAFAAFGKENKPPVDVDQRLADMRYKGEGETGIHKTQLSVTAALLNRGVPIDDVIEIVLTATRKAAGKDGDGWHAEEQKILGMCESWRKKHPQEEHPQQTTPQEQIEPADLWGKFEPAALPRGLLPKVIEDYAFTMGETMGADPAGFAMAALTVCGAAISDDIKLRMKRHSEFWQECGRLWAAIVGLPSFKKTPTMTAAARPLRKRDHEMLRQFQFEQKKYKDLSNEERKGVEPTLQRRQCLEDTTIEAAQEVLIGSPNGVLLYQDELSGFFGAMDKYAGSRGAAKDRSFWLQSWTGGPYGLNRVGRGVSFIPNLSVSLLGGIQPDVIRRIAAESHDDGFLARMLPIMVRPAVVGRDAPAPPVAEEYGKLVERLTKLAPPSAADPFEAHACTTISLKFDEGAQELREELERKHLALAQQFEVINKKLAAAIGKYDGYFGRLCLIWHCVEHAHDEALPRVVTEDTARQVADFMHHFLRPHALAFYCGVLGLADDHDRLAAVAGYILAHRLEKVTNRDVHRGDRSMRRLTRRETDEVFEQLEALGWLTPTPGPRQGVHWINPEVHVRFAERAAKEAAQRRATRELIATQIRGAARGL
jgi:hypothetical protein